MGGKKSNRIRERLYKWKSVQTWQLLLLLVPLVFLAATLLRFDHIKMAKLRQAVIDADTVGDQENINSGLKELEDFVFSHVVINVLDDNGNQRIIFGTGPFYLEGSYIRAANAAIEEAENTLADDSNPNGNIYEAVRQVCQPLAHQNGWNSHQQEYLDCWTGELAKYPATETLSSAIISANVPSTELFRYDFASPLLAPTAAGGVILICIIILIIIFMRLIVWIVLKIALGITEFRDKLAAKSRH